MILLFPVEHYTIKMDIIRFCLLPESTVLKICYKKYEYVSVKK